MYKQKTHQERIPQEQKHFENDDRKKKKLITCPMESECEK